MNIEKMNQTALELYLYMGSHEEIIDWLKKEGVNSRVGAIQKLQPLVRSNMMSVMMAGAGSLDGTNLTVKKVFDYFSE